MADKKTPSNKVKLKKETVKHFTPSETAMEKLAANRAGQLTQIQRTPLMIAAVTAAIGFLCPAAFFIGNIIGFVTGAETFGMAGLLGWFLLCGMYMSMFALGVILWVNVTMFLPEALSKNPVRWEKGILEIRMATRERPEMPFSYIIGSYSFAPFVAPNDVPMQIGREYIVYYTARSRLLLSMAPTDQPESENWLPLQAQPDDQSASLSETT